MSIFVYAGSMQFMLVTLLAGAQSLMNTFVMTLFINGRHLFTVCPLLKIQGDGKSIPLYGIFFDG